jgi:hypothetical protein
MKNTITYVYKVVDKNVFSWFVDFTTVGCVDVLSTARKIIKWCKPLPLSLALNRYRLGVGFLILPKQQPADRV